MEPISSYTDLLNFLISRMKYESYLEIGVQYAERNFDKIACAVKDGVDICACCKCNYHMSSDEFWATPGRNYDLIFIDGDHRAFPALRDMVHAVERLTPKGAVVVDNINPGCEGDTILSADGTVWQAWAIMRMARPDLSMVAIDTRIDRIDPHFRRGWGVITKGSQKPFAPDESKAGLPCYFGENWKLNWEYLDRFRAGLMNLVTIYDFINHEVPRMFPEAT